MDPSDVLPIEIVLGHIISEFELPEICTLRQVSSKWREIIKLYLSRLRNLDLTEVKHILTEHGFFSIITELAKLREICLDGCWIIATEINLFTLFKNCPQLKSFSSKRCKFVCDDVLEELSRRCSSLENLNIDSCFQVNT